MAPYIQDSVPPSRAKTPVSVKEGRSLTPAPARGISYFTPAQNPPSGTALSGPDGGEIPKLFTPLKIRGVQMQNRIWVSPMCQYSAHEGFHTMWHDSHYGGMAQRGVSTSDYYGMLRILTIFSPVY